MDIVFQDEILDEHTQDIILKTSNCIGELYSDLGDKDFRVAVGYLRNVLDDDEKLRGNLYELFVTGLAISKRRFEEEVR